MKVIYLVAIIFTRPFFKILKFTEAQSNVTSRKERCLLARRELTPDRVGLGNDRIPYSRSNISAPVIFQGSQVQDMCAIYMLPHVMTKGGEGERQ